MNKVTVKQNFALGLGSNLGHSELIIDDAITKLKLAGVQNIICADLIKSKPVDCVAGTPDFTNTALIGYWDKTAEALLGVCQNIEIELGRPTIHAQNESRTIDLDILLFDKQLVSTPQLTLPHPRMHQRLFVLKPLNQIAPNWIIPKMGSVQDTLNLATQI